MTAGQAVVTSGQSTGTVSALGLAAGLLTVAFGGAVAAARPRQPEASR
jgi:hypothetical protein